MTQHLQLQVRGSAGLFHDLTGEQGPDVRFPPPDALQEKFYLVYCHPDSAGMMASARVGPSAPTALFDPVLSLPEKEQDLSFP